MSKRLGDKVEYQNENFNGVCDFRSRFHDGWVVRENLHEYSELLFCRKGQGTVSVNGQSIPISKNQMVWIPPNYIHGYDFPAAEVICAVFSNDLIPLFFRALDGRYFCVSAVDVPDLVQYLEKLPSLVKEDYLNVSGYLNLIGAAVMARSDSVNKNKPDGILYQKVISYISEHFTENITLAGVARMFGYNEKYLSHTLHALTGIHFRKLVVFYRINHAKRLLEKENGMIITQIAEESGFSALNTFNRAFREMTGLTPSEYRQKFAK